MSLTSECLVRQCLHRLPPTCRADCSAHGVHQLGRPSLADPRFHAGAPACTCPSLSAYGTSGLFAGRSPGGSNGQKAFVALAPHTSKVQGGRSDRARRPPGAALRSWRRRLAPCKQCGGAHDPWVRRDRGQGSPPPPGMPACTAASITKQDSVAKRSGGTTKQLLLVTNGLARHSSSPPAML